MSQKNNLIVILAVLVIIFVAPLILAVVLVNRGTWHGHTVNHGILLSKPIVLTEFAVKNLDGSPFLWNNHPRKWWLMYVLPPQCTTDCDTIIYYLHQKIGRAHV